MPYVMGLVLNRGFLQRQDYVTAPTSPLPDWVNRANRAHMNSVENFSSFAAVVIVSNLIGFSNIWTVRLAAVFFFARLAHAVIQISGFQYFRARTVIFGVANTAAIIYGGLLLIQLL